MRLLKKHNRKSLLIAALTISLAAGSVPAAVYAASYNKVSDGTYQLLDGTAITGVTARGIDVSHWRGSIDWQQVAGDDVSFAMLGTRYRGEVDPYFHQFAEGAHANGIQVGAYIYSYALDVAGAEAEADFVLNLIKDYPISYPIAYDMEDSSQSGLTPQQLAEMVNAFCSKIEAAGYYPLLYANDYWLANRIDMSMVDYDVWVARYEVKHAFRNPVMWQATSSGTIAGINGGVDINFQYRDFSADIPPNRWRTIGGNTYYYQNYRMQKDSWIQDGTGWFYLNGSGQPQTGWLTQNGTRYHLDENSGRMTQGWLQTTDGWYYFAGSGAMQSGWASDGNAWYYLTQSGLMKTGWLQEGSTWYYLRESGAMTTAWRQIDGSWYYFNGSGVMLTGWVGDDSAWYYLNPDNGAMFANTQITVDNVTYQVDASGVCHTVVPEEAAESTPQPADQVPGQNNDGTPDQNNGQTSDQPGTIQSPAPESNVIAIVPPLS